MSDGRDRPANGRRELAACFKQANFPDGFAAYLAETIGMESLENFVNFARQANYEERVVSMWRLALGSCCPTRGAAPVQSGRLVCHCPAVSPCHSDVLLSALAHYSKNAEGHKVRSATIKAQPGRCMRRTTHSLEPLDEVLVSRIRRA